MVTNVGGHYLGDPEFAPIFDELNRRKAVVCIHPNDAPFEPLQKVKAPWATIEFPLETTRTFGYMLWGGTLDAALISNSSFLMRGAPSPLSSAGIWEPRSPRNPCCASTTTPPDRPTSGR